MELTWVAAASLVSVGVGYAFVQRMQQSPLVVWTVLATTLFVLSTRDLLRSREQLGTGGSPSEEPTDSVLAGPSVSATDATPTDATPTDAEDRRRDAGTESNRLTLFARLRRRVGSWLT